MAGNLENILKQGECIPEKMLLQYLAGSLPAHDTHQVEKHLLECEFCSDALEGLKMVPASRINEITSDLNRKIDARLKTTGERKPVIIPFFTSYRIAAVIALFILFGGGYWYLNKMEGEKKLAQNVSLPKAESADSVYPQPEAQFVPAPNTDQKSTERIVYKPTPPSANKISVAESPIEVTSTYDLQTSEDAGKRDDHEKALSDQLTVKDEAVKSETTMSETGSTKINAVSGANQTRSATAEPVITESNIVLMDRASGDMKEISVEKREMAKSKSNDAFFISPANLFERAKANYLQKKYTEAENDFEQLLSDTTTGFYDDAKWFLANCYTKNHKNAKARKLLKEISSSNSVHKREAHGLLQELQ